MSNLKSDVRAPRQEPIYKVAETTSFLSPTPLDTFALGILCAEVQRKGTGLSIGRLGDIIKLAQTMLNLLETAKQ